MHSNRPTDERWMEQACRLAARGEGLTRPNPPVGALVVRHGRRVGWGYHRRAGGAHAEIYALRMAGDKANGATLYVTLEPCCTHGLTPPCTDAVVASGVRRVVVGCKDPNPQHAGRGIRMLRRAGIEVTVGVCGSTAEELIAPFARWIRTRMPYVTLKMAMTMDGRIADAKGHSRWITHPAARAAVHRLRKRADAIMVGSGTVSKDDPSLTSSLRAAPAAWRIVTSASGRIPADCRLLCDGHAARTIVAMGPGATPSRRRCTEAAGARAIVVPTKDGKLMIRSLIKALGKMGLLHVVCEGGGALAASLVREKLVDEYWFFIAGRFLGDGGAVPVLRGCTWPLRSAPHVRIVSVSMVGPDVLVRGVPER